MSNLIPYSIDYDGFTFIGYKEKQDLPYITVSAKGIANGLSDKVNDGADFGPDTPNTTTYGIAEAYKYAVSNKIFHIKVRSGTYLIDSQIEITTPVWFEGSGGMPTMNEVADGVYDSYNNSYTGELSVFKLNTNILNNSIPFMFYSTRYMSGMRMTDLLIDCNGNGGAMSFTSPSSAPNNAHFDFTRTAVINTVSAVPLLCDFSGYGDLDLINLTLDNQNNGTVLGSCIKIGGANCTVRLINLMIYSYNPTNGDLIINDAPSSSYQVILLYGGLLQNVYAGTNIGYLGLVNVIDAVILLSGTSTNLPIRELYMQGSFGAPVFNLSKVTTTSAMQVIKAVIDGSWVQSGIFGNTPSGVNLTSIFGKVEARNCIAPTSSVVPGMTLPEIGNTGQYELNTNNVLGVIPTLPANPPVSGTVYQNTNPYDILINLPIWDATTSAIASVKYSVAPSTADLDNNVLYRFISQYTTSTAPEIIQMRVPAGWYYEIYGAEVGTIDIGTAVVQAV
ncbi:MAG: hypothetical protein OWT28_06395 [Firmicutes bacterium]|nr:hypothetical protein [Bacillota bacterium]